MSAITEAANAALEANFAMRDLEADEAGEFMSRYQQALETLTAEPARSLRDLSAKARILREMLVQEFGDQGPPGSAGRVERLAWQVVTDLLWLM